MLKRVADGRVAPLRRFAVVSLIEQSTWTGWTRRGKILGVLSEVFDTINMSISLYFRT